MADSQVNEGVASTRLGMVGWPAEGEELEIARDTALCRLTAARCNPAITTKRGLHLVAAAKAEALPVTCEVTPHHISLTEGRHHRRVPDRAEGEPAAAHRREDAVALIEGLANGKIDAIVTDHALHTDWEKDREFELAPVT